MVASGWLTLTLVTVLTIAQCAIQLRRKIVQGGVSYIKVQKYTNDSLPMMIGKREEELGLDLLMMADYSLYRGFVDIAKGDYLSAQHSVSEYLTAMFEQMKIIYDDIEVLKQTIQLNMVGTFITIREDDCPMLSEIEEDDKLLNNTGMDVNDMNSTDMSLSIPALTAINKLNVWLKKFDKYLPKHDHAILITKFDLLSPRGDSSTQGMAYVGAICKFGESSSVVEDIGAAATALIAAHELGHSLGAFHDGNVESQECHSGQNYLMASTVSGTEDDRLFANSRIMSSCSIQSIEKNLVKPTIRCVYKQKSGDRRLKKKSLLEGGLKRKPGEMFTIHQQCQIAFGPHYGVCPNKEYFRIRDSCRRLWCKNRNLRRSEPCETRTYLPALDGTDCGLEKWCIAGHCVVNKEKVIECQDINSKTCARYSKAKLRHYCKTKDFRNICCHSCRELKII